MRALIELQVQENEITKLTDIDNLPSLKLINLTKNAIDKFDAPLPKLPLLHELNVTENKITDRKEFAKLN